jgi:RNA-binding protein YlmH
MNTDIKLLMAKTEDLFRLCDKHCEAKFSAFLDGAEAAMVEDEFRIPYGYNTMFFGGYDGAERKVFGVFPEWQEAEKEDFPITVIRFDAPKFKTLTHRDYLGTLMSLGIDRNKTGDILIDEDGAYAFVSSDIADFVVRNVKKIANSGVKASTVDMEDFTPPAPKTVQKTCVCASLRLDAVISAALNISRAVAEKLIREGLVKVNHREVTDRSKQVESGSLFSVRNYGRFILSDTGNNTRKGRLHITIEKFI